MRRRLLLFFLLSLCIPVQLWAQTDTVKLHEVVVYGIPRQKFTTGAKSVVYGSGYVARFNPETYEEELLIELERDAPSGKMQLVNNTLYYHTSRYNEDYSKTFNAIYALNLSEGTPSPVQVLEKENLKTFGIEQETGNIYAGIALGADAGTVVVFDKEGKELHNFAAGRFPQEIIFR